MTHRRPARRPRLLLAALAAVLACAIAAPAAGAAEPGLNVGGNFFFSGPTYQALNQSGTHYVRFFMFWQTIEPEVGHFDDFALRAYESALSNLPPGTKALFVIVGAPQWANGSTDYHAPPRDPGAYAAFVHLIASRFAGRVAAYEIWNEEDAPIWWTGNAAQYVDLLRHAYPAIKSADPAARVVMGGLTGNDYHFLQTAYADGAKGYFDVVSDHTDTACNLRAPSEYFRDADGRIDQYTFLGYREVHAVMLANGDDKPIWLSEMGWNTSRRLCDGGLFKGQKAGGVSEETQASFLSQAYHCLAADPYVQVAFWFDLQDQTPIDTSQGRFGLLRTDFSHKPSFNAFRDYALNGDRQSGACGNFSGPSLQIANPLDGSSYNGPLSITVSASSPSGVSEIQLRYDGGKTIRNFSARGGKPPILRGHIDWMHAKHLSPGRHTVTFIAIDPQGNRTSRTVTVIHGAVAAKAHRSNRRHKRARRHLKHRKHH